MRFLHFTETFRMMIVNGGFVYVCVKYVEDALKEAIQKKHSKQIKKQVAVKPQDDLLVWHRRGNH